VGILLLSMTVCVVCGLCYASLNRTRRGTGRRHRSHHASSSNGGAKYTRLGQHDQESVELRSMLFSFCCSTSLPVRHRVLCRVFLVCAGLFGFYYMALSAHLPRRLDRARRAAVLA